ncbi:hypothetical protein P7C70_g5373, partial [Phenoliferia sp. Uapishka_3]
MIPYSLLTPLAALALISNVCAAVCADYYVDTLGYYCSDSGEGLTSSAGGGAFLSYPSESDDPCPTLPVGCRFAKIKDFEATAGYREGDASFGDVEWFADPNKYYQVYDNTPCMQDGACSREASAQFYAGVQFETWGPPRSDQPDVSSLICLSNNASTNINFNFTPSVADPSCIYENIFVASTASGSSTDVQLSYTSGFTVSSDFSTTNTGEDDMSGSLSVSITEKADPGDIGVEGTEIGTYTVGSSTSTAISKDSGTQIMNSTTLSTTVHQPEGSTCSILYTKRTCTRTVSYTIPYVLSGTYRKGFVACDPSNARGSAYGADGILQVEVLHASFLTTFLSFPLIFKTFLQDLGTLDQRTISNTILASFWTPPGSPNGVCGLTDAAGPSYGCKGSGFGDCCVRNRGSDGNYQNGSTCQASLDECEDQGCDPTYGRCGALPVSTKSKAKPSSSSSKTTSHSSRHSHPSSTLKQCPTFFVVKALELHTPVLCEELLFFQALKLDPSLFIFFAPFNLFSTLFFPKAFKLASPLLIHEGLLQALFVQQALELQLHSPFVVSEGFL